MHTPLFTAPPGPSWHVHVTLITRDGNGTGRHSRSVFPGHYMTAHDSGAGLLHDVIAAAHAAARDVTADSVAALTLRVETRWDGQTEHVLRVLAVIERSGRKV